MEIIRRPTKEELEIMTETWKQIEKHVPKFNETHKKRIYFSLKIHDERTDLLPLDL